MADAAGSHSENEWWQNLKNVALYAGKEVIEKALILFYAAQRPETPIWAKTVIYSSLAYLILPTDAVPDFIPMAGYADDLTSLIAALGAVAMCITPEVRQAAKQKAQDWFGSIEPTVQTSSGTATDMPRTIEID